jgi:transposase-like protein
MEKTRKKKAESQGVPQALLPILGLLVTVKTSLLDLVLSSGLKMLGVLLEQEREELCGARYRHDPARKVTRAGYADAELVLGGRLVSVKRPRARTTEGKSKGGKSKSKEVPLPSWEKFAEEDPLTARAVEQMVLGVATRKYGRSLEPMPPGVKTRGTSKSAVSRRFVEATTEGLETWLKRKLSDLSLAALMLDGIVCGEHTALIALGIDEQGSKHVLGVWEGATENAAACQGLLSDLVERGLDTKRTMLVVIDGSKALAKAVRDTFGKRALIQRCQVHKKRNVLEHLPEKARASTGAMISTAYGCSDPTRALDILNKLARQLERKHPSAAASLREGLEETLTVLSFKLDDEALRRTLVTTNPIENLNSVLRRIHRNVKRWRDGTMVLRWVGVGLQEATKGFHRLKGHAGMPKLLTALRAHDTRLAGDGALASQKKAA